MNRHSRNALILSVLGIISFVFSNEIASIIDGKSRTYTTLELTSFYIFFSLGFILLISSFISGIVGFKGKGSKTSRYSALLFVPLVIVITSCIFWLLLSAF